MTPKEYLDAHGINRDTYKKFGLTATKDTISIPIYDEQGELAFTKTRNLNTEPKYRNSEGSHAILFNYFAIKDLATDAIVIAEGEFDCMRLRQEGIPAVSSTGGAKTFNPNWAELLTGKKIFICYDNDEPGKEGTTKLFKIFPEAKAILIPDGCKDVCEYFSLGCTKEEFMALPQVTLSEWKKLNKPKEYALLLGTDLVNRELPKEEWLIDRVIPSEGFTFIVGAEATGKSFTTLSIAEAVTTGKAWLGRFEVKKTTNVLFIDKENTQRRTQTRMKGLGISGENMFWLEHPEFFDIRDEKEEDGFSPFIKAIAEEVAEHSIGLIIVDSFTDVMVGNENAAADTQAFFDSFRQLFPHISIIVLHHENKPSQGVQRNSSQRFRGSTNITAQIVVGFRVEALTRSKGEFTFEQTKAGDAERLNKFKVKMNTIFDPNDTSKTIVARLSFEGEVRDDLAAVDEAVTFVSEYLENNSKGFRKVLITDALAEGLTEASVRRALEMLLERRIISSKKIGKEVCYQLLLTETLTEDTSDSPLFR